MLRFGLGRRKSLSTTQAAKGKGFVAKKFFLQASKNSCNQNSGARAWSTPAQGVKQSWSCSMSTDAKGLLRDRIISWEGLALTTVLSGPECFVCISTESYQIAVLYLFSLQLMYELMKKTPFPVPKLSKTSHCSSVLQFELSNCKFLSCSLAVIKANTVWIYFRKRTYFKTTQLIWVSFSHLWQ